MTRRQYVGALVVLASAGLLGGALSGALLSASPAFAQRRQPPPAPGPQILTPMEIDLPKSIDCEKLRLLDGDGKEILVLRRSGSEVLLERTEGHVVEIRDRDGNRVRLAPSGLTIRSQTKVSVTAPMVKVQTPLAEFTGTVKCDTLTTNSVIATSYTPGAGNVW